jgi:hypothetical protein
VRLVERLLSFRLEPLIRRNTVLLRAFRADVPWLAAAVTDDLTFVIAGLGKAVGLGVFGFFVVPDVDALVAALDFLPSRVKLVGREHFHARFHCLGPLIIPLVGSKGEMHGETIKERTVFIWVGTLNEQVYC